MDGLTCDEFLETKLQKRIDFLNENLFPLENEHNDILKDFEKYTKILLRAKKTDNYGPVRRFLASSRFKDILKFSNDNDAEKENATNSSNNNPSIKVKTEKLSLPSQSACDDTINMPAPKMPPPKTKRIKKEKISNVQTVQQVSETNESKEPKRVTRSNTDRTSDVILQNPVIPVVDLIESSEKEEEAPIRSTRTRTKKQSETAPVRSTRTRTKKTKETKDEEVVEKPTARTTRTKTRTKRDRSESENENVILEKKRSKSDSSTAGGEAMINNVSSHTEYEDAVSQLENKPNETFVISATKTPDSEQVKPMMSRMNETVILDKSKPHQLIVNNPDDMMTDDESIEDQVISPQKKNKKENTKQLFSPYENSPVKKKVEAFENNIQKNETSTFTKLNTSKILKEMGENKGNVREKAKGFIRTGSTNLYKTNTPTASKIGKYTGQKTSMLNGSRVMTPLSGHDFKERELRRLEKEKEQKKREMLKQAMSEEKKKKHDEKMLRIHQLQKEAKEKEMEKALQLQKMKEERVKMVLQQKEEKQRLLKEENERKRLLAKQRAEEKRKEEEALKLALQGKKDNKVKTVTNTTRNHEAEHIPIYLVQPTPPLPCEDCYDSDDERRNNVNQKNTPAWATRSKVKMQDYIQTSVGHKIKNTLFCCKSQNIDLRDVFQRIDEKKLKRTSSAYWDKPPRFTLLPPLQDE